MRTIREAVMLRQMEDLDLSVCLLFNRAGNRPAVRRSFSIVSRLGDGIVWYALMGILPLAAGNAGLRTALHMGAVGAVGTGLYTLIKRTCIRERPFAASPHVCRGATPLDRYSFPSGHTLHAVGFTLVAVSRFPVLAWALVPFAALVAASRMVLGLHYPSDVLAGAAIGGLLATAPIDRIVPFFRRKDAAR